MYYDQHAIELNRFRQRRESETYNIQCCPRSVCTYIYETTTHTTCLLHWFKWHIAATRQIQSIMYTSVCPAVIKSVTLIQRYPLFYIKESTRRQSYAFCDARRLGEKYAFRKVPRQSHIDETKSRHKTKLCILSRHETKLRVLLHSSVVDELREL